MSTTSSVSSTSALATIASTLLNNYDSNSDGKLSADEFNSFISQLAGQLNLSTSSVKTASTTVATTPLLSSTAGTASGGSGNVKFEGFNLERTQNPGKSAKDAFAQLAQQAGSMPNSKTEAETWFNTYIKSGMEGLGHKVNWVEGDKFQFSNWQGTFTVDFVRGASSGAPALAWQATEG